MTYHVRALPAVDADIDRLVGFLLEHDASAALKANDLIRNGIKSLNQLPGRGRPTRKSDVRELVLWFGRAAYVVRYRVGADEVVVMSVRHSLERPPE